METIKITLRYEVTQEDFEEIREAGYTLEEASIIVLDNLLAILSALGASPASSEVSV